MFRADGVRQERSNWRDQALSLRHRECGRQGIGFDIDPAYCLETVRRLTAQQPSFFEEVLA